MPPDDDDCSTGTPDAPVSPDAATARACSIACPVKETEELLLFEALGRVLSDAPRAAFAIPPFNNSAMDGYAIRTIDFAGDGPWRLPVTARIAAGDAPVVTRTPMVQAVRIFTGAPVPEGFDAVVMQEHCRQEGEFVVVNRPARHGENIRLTGEDVRKGDVLMGAGDLLTPQRLALLAGAGVSKVQVFRKVRIALLATGSELREPGETLQPGQIFNANRFLLRSTLAACEWVDVHDYGVVVDERPQLAEAFNSAAQQCDFIVTTGGVSGGDEDHVAAVLLGCGGSLDIIKVAMRPGKPVKIGRIGKALFTGLPGNPNAALVTFRYIALPAMRTVAGLRNVAGAWQPGVSGFDYAKKRDRAEFVPVRMTGHHDGLPVVEMLGRGSSANLSAIASADGIALLPAECDAIESGMKLRIDFF